MSRAARVALVALGLALGMLFALGLVVAREFNLSLELAHGAEPPASSAPAVNLELEALPPPAVPDDCTPCPTDPFLWCCRSLSTVSLAPSTVALLEQCAALVPVLGLIKGLLVDNRERIGRLEACHRDRDPDSCRRAVGTDPTDPQTRKEPPK